MKEFKIENHASSYLPKEKNWTLAWQDEFDGNELDESKWNFREYFWGKKSPTFSREGVSVDGNSNLVIALVKKGDDFYSGHLQTGSLTYDIPKDTNGMWPFGKFEKAKFMHKFGYYEIRCRLPKNPGWHAAFWLQAPGIGSHPNAKYCGVETDIMENYRQHTEGLMLCGNGFGGYGKDSVWPGHFRFPFVETADGWHYYGVDWNKDGYTFYADGKKIGWQGPPDVAVSHVEQFILVSTECHGYNRNFGDNCGDDGHGDMWKGEPVEELKKAVLPDAFIVDHVRVFDEI
ncbi:MAG: glycoside hydrolase family 16 protein [Oscillospiraceae bacterium]|nr:glycoside hydrolase family 16 protein [Oscillospiraceae bacterium]